MDRLVKVVSIDEEFEKGRGKDKRPRKKRGIGRELDYRPARAPKGRFGRPTDIPGGSKLPGVAEVERIFREGARADRAHR